MTLLLHGCRVIFCSC